MNFQNVDEIAKAGFAGFVPVSKLQTTNCSEVPKERGVYLFLRPNGNPPQFLPTSVGGHFKGKNPTVSIAELQANWVIGTSVIYIGKAGSENRTATLRSRLTQYMKFGQGKPVGHWGGRYIWQLADSADLLVCWKPTPTIDPAKAETQLLQDFVSQYSIRPFANLRN